MENTVRISSSSKSSIATQQKIVLADGSLCNRQQSGEGEGGGVGGGARRVSPCSHFALTQIVPMLASIYTVFHSVIFNSVGFYRFEFGLQTVEDEKPVLGPLDLINWRDRQKRIRQVSCPLCYMGSRV